MALLDSHECSSAQRCASTPLPSAVKLESASAPFVGREAELAVLRSCLQRTSEQDPQVALIAGDAGIGKSTLVRFFINEAAPACVLKASGDERETSVAYGIVAQLASVTPAHALREAHGLRAGPLPGVDPLLIGTELSTTWATLARSNLTIVVVEDLQWADIPSSEALLSGVRRLRRGSVLVIATCRPHELARLGGRWERLAASEERCTQIRLSGFDDDAVRTLGRAVRRIDVPRVVAQRIVDHTGGNPLYISALVEELPGSAFAESSGPLPAPRSLSGVIAGRVAALAAPAQSLVVAAAVLGRSCLLETAARLADLSDPLVPLEQAHAAHLLDEVAGSRGREVTFPHPLIRVAVYDDVGAARRRQLHQCAAGLTTGLASLAHRVAAAVGADSDLASRLEAAALEQAGQGKLLTAAELFRQASELSDTAQEHDDRLVRAANCLIRGGDVGRADTLRTSVERCRESSLQQLVLGLMAFSRGDAESCERHVRRAWVLGAQNGGAGGGLDAAVLLGELLIHMGRLDDAERLLNDAWSACPPDAPHYRSIVAGLAMAKLDQGRVVEAMALLGDPAFPPSAETCTPAQLHAVFLRAWARISTEHLEAARDDLTVIQARAHEFRSFRYQYIDAFGLLAHAQHRLGLWSDALANYEETVAMARETEQAWIYPYVHGVAAMARALRGEWHEAEAHAAAAREAESSEFVMGVAYSTAGAATLAWARGNARGVVAVLTDPARERAVSMYGPCLFAFEPLRIDALLDLGLLEEAESCLQALATSPECGYLPSVALDCARLRGKLERLRGSHDGAATAFAAGAELAQSVKSPFAIAMLHLEHGRFLRATRQARAAVRELSRAHALFQQMGAAPFLDATNRELRAPGMPTSTSPAGAPLQLTEKEMRVARSITAGRSNREIAGELFITAKAVEYHVARIYGKLGIASRAELAARFARDLDSQ